MLKDNEPDMLTGTIQLDETFVGGKNKNRHADKKVKNSQGRSFKDKTPVMGMLQQEVYEMVERPHKTQPGKTVIEKRVLQPSVLICKVVADTKSSSIQPIIRSHIEKNSILVSDEWHAYRGLNDNYYHYVVDHAKKQYVNEGGYTSNALEGAWSILKRSVIGTYHKVTPKHLHRYCDEFTYRYNTKGDKAVVRFEIAIKKVGNARLTYKQLIK